MHDISWDRKDFHKIFKIYFTRNDTNKIKIYLIRKVLPHFIGKDLSALGLPVQ